MKKWTVVKFREAKGQTKLACVTAYDYAFAKLADEAGIPLVLVGDSLGMTMLGYSSTLPVTMDDMLRHTAAVARGASTNTLVIGDLPFLSYQVNLEEGVRNAGRLIQAGADAVKLEGCRPELVRACVETGIPVMGHIGLTPQSVNVFGGFKVQGKTQEAGERLLKEALALEEAGAFALVIECTPPDIAAAITRALKIPTVSCGAGPACDGMIVVLHDMLGFTSHTPKFIKRYAEIGDRVKEAFTTFAREVADGSYPGPEQTYAASGFIPPPPEKS